MLTVSEPKRTFRWFDFFSLDALIILKLLITYQLDDNLGRVSEANRVNRCSLKIFELKGSRVIGRTLNLCKLMRSYLTFPLFRIETPKNYNEIKFISVCTY